MQFSRKKVPFIILYLAVCSLIPTWCTAQSFIHPGILHSQSDLDRMKTAVATKTEPTYSGYQLFVQNPASQYTYHMQGPMASVGRNPTVGQSAYDSDANAAHQNAIMWAITGDKRYAKKAMEIINAWSTALQSITGRDAVLMAGLGPFKMINAAEIMRYTHAGWSQDDIQKTEQHFKKVIAPVIRDFAPFANGNWDAAAIKTMMAIGVFCNDRPIFEQALRYYIAGWGNGSLANYIINESGQIQESGRDQPHSQLGIGMLAESCAIAWNQGLDLYSYDQNRLLKGFEYTAKYNLGHDDMPFSEWLDRTGKYHHTQISDKGRGQLRALYEQVYNHYVILKGLKAPYTAQAAAKLRPEGPGKPGADHPGYGTLFFSQPTTEQARVPVAPAGLVARGSFNGVAISWVASNQATSYTIKRATRTNGPYQIVAKAISNNFYLDTAVEARHQYYYAVEANNRLGTSALSFTQPAMTGLPNTWQQVDIGRINQGHSWYNGQQLDIEAFGYGMKDSADQFHFTYIPLKQDAILTVRIAPQPSSQFSVMGLTLRESTAANAPQVSLLVYPGKTDQIEAPNWHTRFLLRMQTGNRLEVKAIRQGLKEPVVTFGRLTGYYWLRLVRKGNQCQAYSSYDGVQWQAVGATELIIGPTYLLGIAVASGMPNSTSVRFDHLTLNGKPLKAIK